MIDDAHRRVHAKLTRHEWISWEQKQEAFRLMNFKIYPKQEEICKDPHPIRVVRAGRRSGKTTLAAHEAVATMLMKPNSLGWVIGPTYDLTSRCWDMMLDQLDRLAALGYVRYTTRVSTKSQMKVVLDNGAAAEGHTAGGWGEGLQGVGLHWLVMDEIAQIEPWVLLEIVMPAVIQQNGWCFLIGTPLGESWATREYRNAQIREERRGEKSIWSEVIFESWFNTFEFPGGRMDPKIIQMERTMTHEAFMEQICAQPQRSRYVIYKEFVEDVHARKCDFDPDLPVYLSIDPSTGVNPYAVAVFQDYGSMVKMIDEVYQIGAISFDIIKECSSRPWWNNVVEAIVDDASPQEKEVWRRHEDCHFSVKMAKKPGYIEDSLPLVRNWLRDPTIFNGYTEPMRDAIIKKLFPQYAWPDLQDEEKNMVMSHLETEVQDHPDILLKAARFFIDRFRCPNAIDEFRAYAYLKPRRDDRNPKETPVDFKNHLLDCCFAADTIVTCRRGDIPIVDVVVGDEVWTRQGWKHVSASWCSDPDAEVVEVVFANGSKIIATPEQKVWIVGQGWAEVSDLRYNLWSNQLLEAPWITRHTVRPRHASIEARHTTVIQNQPVARKESISGAGGDFSTEISGRTLTASQSRRDGSVITWTETPLIMTSPTSKSYQQPSIRNYIGPIQSSGVNSSLSSVSRAVNSLSPSWAETKISFALTLASPLREESLALTTWSKSALGAGRNSPPESTLKSSAVLNPVAVISVTSVSKRPVYDITVTGTHEFLANGILSHNCRYYLWRHHRHGEGERLAPSRYAEIA